MDDSIAPGTWTGLEFSRNYDAATGDLLSAGSTTEAWVPQARDGARSATTFAHVSDAIHESRSYYSADGMLRVHQANRAKRDGLETTPHLDTLDGVYEVYWYDALGRRVLKRSIQEDGELCDEAHVTCHDTIERFVWDGSQILAEVRATDASNAAAGGPAGPQTGRIVYVHPGGVDAPAGMVRNGVPYALHANWRGLYAFATDSLGRKAEESTVEWPANNRRAFLGRADRRDWVWFGSLVSSGTDASGLLYRRNRYYDPQSGQFTQQDPIGIAGGLNLYGFAGGDPVNNADPFGLKICFRGSEEDIATLREGLEGATGTTINLGSGNCVSGYEATGAEGYEELQAILGQLVDADETYSVIFGDDSKHFYSHYHEPSRTAGIIRQNIGNLPYRHGGWFSCMLGGSGFGYHSLPSLVGHELLGHGSGRLSKRSAIRVENLVHRARGEFPRCRGGR